ncbi:uncharacterized protein LOC114755053 [Neltuma alba]|uniref:uncharacterized protein LOC114755053 n=1 Tax=Neltuma alba TaxID=207710 RepID=UPI0010A4C9FC|nr:uncharacterized protein LOC114755053 [Prosopis alba]
MDRSWIDALRTSDEYECGVDQFLEFVKNNVPNNNGLFYCPCVKCMNRLRQITTEIKDHLICFGFYKVYKQCVLHGESKKHRVCQIEKDDMDMDERVEDMIHDVGVDVVKQLHKYSNLCNDAEKPLYPGCTKYTRLTVVLKLVNLKAKNGWSNKSFTELLILLKDMLPKGNLLPDHNYEAKKILCPIGLGYKKIHACPNDCVLYRKAYDELDACPVCGTSSYKVKEMEGGDVITKGPPAKVLWYLPIIPRFKHLFANANEAKKLRWHVEERKTDGMLRHPTDSSQWKRTSHQQLSHGKKTFYLGHRRFLKPGHPYQRKKKEFNGFQEYKDPPEPLTIDQVYEQVKDVDTVLGKSQKKVTEKNLWKKKSIFFDLPYWKYLEVKHSIDVILIAHDENDESYCDIGETPLSMSTMPQLDEEDKEDGVYSITSEHGDKEDDMYGVYMENSLSIGKKTTKSKNCKRGVTRLTKLAQADGGKIHIEFDKRGEPIDWKEGNTFRSFVVLVAHQKISILINEWDKVRQNDRNEVWDTILITYDIPDTMFMKEKWLSYAAV